MPTNLQQRKDSFRLKFRAPARGTSHDHPQSQVGQEKKTVGGEEGQWYSFSSSQPQVLCDLLARRNSPSQAVHFWFSNDSGSRTETK